MVLTEWNEFRAVDLKRMRNLMRGDVLVDLRNVYPPVLAAAAGFVYSGIGKGSLRQAANGTGRRSHAHGAENFPGAVA